MKKTKKKAKQKQKITVVPAELVLAEMIANAKARGLGRAKFGAYRDEAGSPCEAEKAASCCALGAWWLSPNRFGTPTGLTFDGIVAGNDYDQLHENGDVWGASVGAAFQDALT